MFDLENAIADWKDSLREAGSISPTSLTELESHLRDTIKELSGNKLSTKEAFSVSVMRLGPSADLGQEFSKVNGSYVWRNRTLWMVGGYVGGGAIAGVIGGAGSMSAAAATVSGFSGTIAGVTSIAVMAVCWLCLFLLALYGSSSTTTAFRFPRSPVFIVAMLVLLTIVGKSMAWGGLLIQTRLGSIDQIGATMVTSAYGAFAINLGVFFTCIAVVLVLHPSEKLTPEVA